MGDQPDAPPVVQRNTVELGPQQQNLYKRYALPAIRRAARRDVELFPGSTVAGFTDTELEGQQQTLDAAAGPIATAAGQAANTNAFLANPDLLSPGSNPYLAEHGAEIARITSENLLENILPGLRSGATAAGGAFSGGNTRAQLAEGEAAGRTSREIAGALSGLYNNAYNTGLNTLGQAVDRTGRVQAAQLFGPAAVSAVGAQERGLEQSQLDEEANRFYLQQNLPLLRAQELMGLIGMMPGATGVSSVHPSVPQTDGVMQAIGIGMELLPMLMML